MIWQWIGELVQIISSLISYTQMKKNPLNEESHQIWEALGPWWDANVEDGDYFHRAFVFPTIENLLELQEGHVVLDAGCGNGALSRRISQKGAKVIGVDFSSTLIQQAKQRSEGISYNEMDLTDGAELQKLAQITTFDRVVCSMVLHGMSDIRPFFASLKSLMKPEGYFVFCISHPCFNSPSVVFEPPGAITVRDYIRSITARLRSKPGQPIEQLVFHRPMREYFNLLIAQGMVMNGFEEPCVNPQILPEGALWAQRPEIPPALISRWSFAQIK